MGYKGGNVAGVTEVRGHWGQGFRVSWGLVVLARPGRRRCNTPPAGTALLQLIGFPLRFPKLRVILGEMLGSRDGFGVGGSHGEGAGVAARSAGWEVISPPAPLISAYLTSPMTSY